MKVRRITVNKKEWGEDVSLQCDWELQAWGEEKIYVSQSGLTFFSMISRLQQVMDW